MYLKELTRIYENSTQFYQFSDEVLNKIKTDDLVNNWVSNWIFSFGPGSDARFMPDYSVDDYLGTLIPDEMEYLERTVKELFGVKFKNESEEPSPTTPPEPDTIVRGTLIVIQNYGSDLEPQKYMWNNARGEVLDKNQDGSYKVRITDVKDSNVLYSKRWYDAEQQAMRQRLNLKREEFKTLKELDDEANAG